jgi:hypothetical protein
MKQHAFSPRGLSLRGSSLRGAAAAAGLAVLLAAGTATGALAATPAPAAPGAPTGLTAAPGDGTATLSWSAPGSDGGSPVTAYVIEGGPGPSQSVSGLTGTVSGLTDGTAYSFSVHAQNAVGDGPAATVTVTPQGAVPGAPGGLTTSYGDGFIALSWSAPAAAGGSPVTGYRVYLGTSSSFASFKEFTTSGPSFRTTDVQNGSTYFIKVTAVNAAGEGPATSVASVTPVARAVPSAPTGLTARAGHGEVILSWSPPPGGLKAGEGYLIYLGTSPGGEGAKPSVPNLIESTTSYAIAPLTDGTRYYFQVALLDGSNQVSARSAEVSAVPAAGTSAGSSASTPAGVGDATASPTASTQRDAGPSHNHTSSSTHTALIILLAAVTLAATGGAIAIIVIQRRRHGRGHAAVPAPRRPYDDHPAGPSSRVEELNGPRYR